MRRNYLCTFLLFVFFFCIPSAHANAAFVIDERSAWGYEYVVTKENGNFTWDIGYEGKTATTMENKENERYLQGFREAVGKIDGGVFKLLLASSFVVIVGIMAFMMYKKNKKVWKESWGIFGIFAIAGLYVIFTTYLDVDMAFNDARVYYGMLTEWR